LLCRITVLYRGYREEVHSRKPEWDLEEAFVYHPQEGLQLDDIRTVLAAVPGDISVAGLDPLRGV
jgi:hypothetical protein